MREKTCCFFGHRNLTVTEFIKDELYNTVKDLIENKNVSIFLFGSKSIFNTLCYQTVSKIKKEYPHIKRVYVRAEYPEINKDYRSYLLENYENTYFPYSALKAGNAVYLKRNYYMIDNSDFCIVYCDYNYQPTPKRNYLSKTSGTKKAVDYAAKKQKRIINIFG